MTWAQVQKFINVHSLPYSVQRFNMSLRGCLVDAWSGEAVANTARLAMAHLKGVR